MRAKVTILALILTLAGSPAPAASQAAPDRLDVSDVLDLAHFSDRTQLDLSPDGRRVAFTLVDPWRAAAAERNAYFDDTGVPRSQRGTDVWVAEMDGGETRRLMDGMGTSWGPVWSPDGRWLAFYSDRDGAACVWLWDAMRDRLTRLSEERVRPFWGFEQIRWSPDGGRVLVKLMPEGRTEAELEALYPDRGAPDEDPPPDPGAVTARVFAYSPDPPEPGGGDDEAPAPPPVDLETAPSFLNVQLGDLALLEVPSGRVTRMARGVRAIGYRFSPDGTRVAYTTRQPDGGEGALVYNRYDLWVAPADGSASPRLLAPTTVAEYGLGFSWSPDGRAVAYHDGDRVRVARADDGAPVRAFGHAELPLQHDYRPPLWLDNETLVALARDTLWRLSLTAPDSSTALGAGDGWRLHEIVAPASAQRLDGRTVLVAMSEPHTKRVGFRRIALAGGAPLILWTADMALGATDLTYHLDASADGRTVAFVAESGARPPEVWVSDAGFQRPRRLTDLHPAITGRALGESRLVEWTGQSGDTLQGALLLPADYRTGTRYPLVVKVYGASRLSHRLNRFGLESGIDNLQLLATRGYAVLLPDAPTRPGTPMADIAEAVEGGARAVVALGVADPDRMAVFGHSYGGYSALGTAALSDAFRAVVASGGISDLFAHYRMLRPDGSAIGVSWSERGQGRMGGHPWSHPERYRDNSPFFHLDRVTAPVLLLHGAADPTALPAESEAVFVGLRRLGKEVTLVLYEGEGHHPGSWSAANAEDYWRRIFRWLEEHLGDSNE